MGHPRLTIVGSTYYMRAKVPAELVAVLGKREIKKSLHTGDYQEALPRLRRKSAEADDEITEARRRLASLEADHPVITLSDDEIKEIAAKVYRRALVADDDARGSGKYFWDEDLEREQDYILTIADGARFDLSRGQYHGADFETHDLLRDAGRARHRLDQVVGAHPQKTPVEHTLLADEDGLHRRLHVVVVLCPERLCALQAVDPTVLDDSGAHNDQRPASHSSSFGSLCQTGLRGGPTEEVEGT